MAHGTEPVPGTRKGKEGRQAGFKFANGGGGTWSYHYSEPRPLTNRERARLQPFPDDFAFWGNIGEVRKQIGNAVPRLGAKAIAEQLRRTLTDTSASKAKMPIQLTVRSFA